MSQVFFAIGPSARVVLNSGNPADDLFIEEVEAVVQHSNVLCVQSNQRTER